MIDVPLGVLVGALIVLVLLSAFFSAAEIALMSLNRYRLRHLTETGHRGAKIAATLLQRPDRLLGVILLGNNFVNIAASSVATIMALELYGEGAIAAAAFLLTFVILVFAEVAPKTVAALHPEKIAFPAVYILKPLLVLLRPIVWLINAIANRLLRLFGVPLYKSKDQLSAEELKAVVREAGSLIPEVHQKMLLALLDLEKTTVEDVMVPRGEIEAVNLDADWDEIVAKLTSSHYTRLPVYRGNLDKVVGVAHLRKVLNLIQSGRFDRDTFMQIIMEPYFIPAGTPLNTQLLNFRQAKRRMALVVDEYGELLGLVTLEEILEEVVGEFTTQAPSASEEIRAQDDGSYLVNGSTNIRDLNRKLSWQLPTAGPKTVNGVIMEYLEAIPEAGTSLLLDGYLVEIVRTRGPRVQLVRIRPHQAAVKASQG